MNAVNLIPEGRRDGGRRSRAGAPFLGLAAGLLLVLVAGVLDATVHNTVSRRQARLAQTSAAVTRWKLAADGFERDVTAGQAHAAALGQVRELAATRYDWSRLLGQVAGLMPAGSQLTSMQATGPTASSGASASASASTGASGSGIQISGCAASQPTVAETMDQLRRITGISAVLLSSSTVASSSGGAGASGGGSGGCAYSVDFEMSLQFAAPSAGGSSASTAPSTAPSASASGASTGSGEVSQ